jgi:hypothetical protein
MPVKKEGLLVALIRCSFFSKIAGTLRGPSSDLLRRQRTEITRAHSDLRGGEDAREATAAVPEATSSTSTARGRLRAAPRRPRRAEPLFGGRSVNGTF